MENKITDKQSGKQSVYSNDIGGTDHLNGFRVRLTVAINTLGLMSAPLISTTGVSREELLLDGYSSGAYIIHILGLCAGLSVDPRHDTPGYIVFVRCEKSDKTQISAEQRNFQWYRSNIILPFIEMCHVKYYDWTFGTSQNTLTLSTI